MRDEYQHYQWRVVELTTGETHQFETFFKGWCNDDKKYNVTLDGKHLAWAETLGECAFEIDCAIKERGWQVVDEMKF